MDSEFILDQENRIQDIRTEWRHRAAKERSRERWEEALKAGQDEAMHVPLRRAAPQNYNTIDAQLSEPRFLADEQNVGHHIKVQRQPSDRSQSDLASDRRDLLQQLLYQNGGLESQQSTARHRNSTNKFTQLAEMQSFGPSSLQPKMVQAEPSVLAGSGAPQRAEPEDRVSDAGEDALAQARKETRFKREPQNSNRIAISSKVGEIEVNEGKDRRAESAAEWGDRHAMALKAVDSEPNSQIKHNSNFNSSNTASACEIHADLTEGRRIDEQSLESNSLFHQLVSIQHDPLKDKYLASTHEGNAKFHQELHQRARALSNTRISKGTRNEEARSRASPASHLTNSEMTSDQQVMSFGKGAIKAPLSGSISSFDALKHHKPASSQNIKFCSSKMAEEPISVSKPNRDMDKQDSTTGGTNLFLFAEKASMRFTMKELAGILDDLNFQLSKQAMQHEKLERQETMAQLRAVRNQADGDGIPNDASEENALRIQKMSNFELLEHIRLESRVMKVRFQEMNKAEDNVWRRCIELREKNQYLRNQLIDMREDNQRLQTELGKVTGDIDLKEDRSRKWGSAKDLEMNHEHWKTRDTNNCGGEVSKFGGRFDQDSISNENVHQIVSFRYDPNQDLVSSLSARKLAKKFATGDVSEQDAVSMINQKLAEKDQHIKILNEYIGKLKRELAAERKKAEKAKQLNMPLSTCNRKFGSIRSSQSMESLEPSGYPSLAPTAFSGAEASQGPEPRRDLAENDYIQTSVDDESYVRTTKDYSDRTARDEAISHRERAKPAAGADKDKFEELYNQIYQLTNQVQSLEGHIKGRDPMNTSYFKNGNFLVVDGNYDSQQTAWMEEPTGSQGGSEDLLQELPRQMNAQGSIPASSAPRESEDRDSVGDMAYMQQIVDSNPGPDKFGQQYNFNQPFSRSRSVVNTAAASRAAFSGLSTAKNGCQPFDTNPNGTIVRSNNFHTPKTQTQKTHQQMNFQEHPAPCKETPMNTNSNTEYLKLQTKNLEQTSRIKRLITDNFQLQTAIQELQADLDQEIERVENYRQQNEDLTAMFEQKDDELQKLRILNNEQQYFNDADKVIIESLKRDLEHHAQQIADCAKQLSDLKEQNQKLQDEKAELLEMTKEGKIEVEKMINDYEEEKAEMAKEVKQLKDEVNLAKREATQRVAEVQSENRMKEEAREKVYRQRIEEKEKVLEELHIKLVASEREFLNQKRELQRQVDELQQQYFDQKSTNKKQTEDHRQATCKLQRDGSIKQSELLRLQDENLTLKIQMEEQTQQFQRDIEAKDEHHTHQMSYFRNSRHEIELKRSITCTDRATLSTYRQEDGDYEEFIHKNKQPAKQLLALDELLKVMAELKDVKAAIVDQFEAERLQTALTTFDEFKLKVLDSIILWHERTNDIAIQAAHYDSILREYLAQIAQLKQLVIEKSRHIAAQSTLIKQLRALSSRKVDPVVPDYLLQSFQTLHSSFVSQLRIKEGECTDLIKYQDRFRDEYVLVTNQRDQLAQDKARLQEQVIQIETERNRVIEDQRRYKKQLEEAIGVAGGDEADDVDVLGLILSMRHDRVGCEVLLAEHQTKIQEGVDQLESQRKLFLAQIQTLEEKLDTKQKEWIDTQELLQQEFAEKELGYEKEIKAEKDIAISLAKDLEFQERKNEKLEQKMLAEFNRVNTLKSGMEAQQLEALQQSDKLKMLSDTHAVVEAELVQTQKVLDDRLRQLDEQDRAMKEQDLQMKALMSAKDIIALDNSQLLREIQSQEATINNLQKQLDDRKAQASREAAEIQEKLSAEAKAHHQEVLQLKSQLNITKAAHDQQLGEAAEQMNSKCQSLRTQLDQRATKENALFVEIKRYQDSIAYLSRQLDEKNKQIESQNSLKAENEKKIEKLKIELGQNEKKYQALKRLHDCQTERKKQITQRTTQTEQMEMPADKLQKMEKQMFDSMNSQKEYQKENKHMRHLISRQEKEIKNLINDKRELENQVLILGARRQQEVTAYKSSSQFGEAQSSLVIFEKDKYIANLESEILELRTELGALKEKEIELEMESLLQTNRSGKDKVAPKHTRVVSSSEQHLKDHQHASSHRRTSSNLGPSKHQRLHQHSLSTYGVNTTQQDGSTVGRSKDRH